MTLSHEKPGYQLYQSRRNVPYDSQQDMQLEGMCPANKDVHVKWGTADIKVWVILHNQAEHRKTELTF